jgi:hypothetical protein
MENQAPQRPEKLSRHDRHLLRWERRIERYEAKRNGPPPPRRLHRAIVTLLMMGMMLGLLLLLLNGPTDPALAPQDAPVEQPVPQQQPAP